MANSRNDCGTRALGERGKELVEDLFRHNGYLVQKPYKANAGDFIDFIATGHNTQVKVFVRTDTRICVSDNVVIERFTHRASGPEIGWLFKGRADLLCYLDAHKGTAYFFDWQALKDYVTTHCKARPFRNPYDNNATGDAYIVSVRELMKAGGLCSGTCHVNVAALQALAPNQPAPF